MPTWNENKRAWVSLHESTSYPIEVVTLAALPADTWTAIPEAPTVKRPARIRPHGAVEVRKVDTGFEVRSPVALTDLKIEVDY